MEHQVEIPKIDIGCLFQEDYHSERCRSVILAIDKACRQVGFFTVHNHPIKEQIMNKMFEKAHQFFHLPPSKKLQVTPKKWNPNSTNIYRGFFPSKVNGKQGMDIQDPQMKTIPQKYSHEYFYEHNKFPSGLSSDWQQTMGNYFTLAYNTAVALTKAVYYAFQKQKQWEHFQEGLKRPYHLSTFRFNYYPKSDENRTPVEISQEDGAKLACQTHVDHSIITLLSQDSIGGLQVRNKFGKWQHVPYDKNALVINTGRLLQHLTNGIYQPTYHRVLMNYHERVSIPLFFEPASDTILDPHVLGSNSTHTEYHKEEYRTVLRRFLGQIKQYMRQESQ